MSEPTGIRESSLRTLLLHYVPKFGLVGAAGFVLDVGIFNLLRADVGGAPVLESSFTAKTISVTIATVATWFGNRSWTFRDGRRHNKAQEFAEFAAIGIVGMSISLAALYVSRVVLGFESLFADNVSTNFVGLGLATIFRFFMYRFWVFGDKRVDRVLGPRGVPAPVGD